MKVSLEYELITFLSSIVLGLLLGVLYDFFHAVRKCTKRTLLPDVMMWGFALILSFWVWFFWQNGEVRWYTVLGSFFAWVIYFFTVSKYVFLALYFLLDKICLFFRTILKILLTPLRFLGKIISVYNMKAKSEFSKKVEGKYDEKKA